WRGAALWVLSGGTLALGCAGTLDSKDPAYARGRSSFEAARWSEAQDSLDAFLKSTCRWGRAPGCERALWMKSHLDVQLGRPAQAIVDANKVGVIAPLTEPLFPSIPALRERALTELRDSAGDAEPSAHLEASYRNDVRPPCRLLSFAVSLDLRESQPL